MRTNHKETNQVGTLTIQGNNVFHRTLPFVIDQAIEPFFDVANDVLTTVA